MAGRNPTEQVGRQIVALAGQCVPDRSLDAQAAGLGSVYGIYVDLQAIPKPARDRFLRTIVDKPRVFKTPADVIGALLRAIVYRGVLGNSDRAKLSRDTKALAYAARLGVRPEEFVARIREKGHGVQAWAERERVRLAEETSND